MKKFKPLFLDEKIPLAWDILFEGWGTKPYVCTEFENFTPFQSVTDKGMNEYFSIVHSFSRNFVGQISVERYNLLRKIRPTASVASSVRFLDTVSLLIKIIVITWVIICTNITRAAPFPY